MYVMQGEIGLQTLKNELAKSLWGAIRVETKRERRSYLKQTYKKVIFLRRLQPVKPMGDFSCIKRPYLDLKMHMSR